MIKNVPVSKGKCWEDLGKEGPRPLKKVRIAVESEPEDIWSEDKSLSTLLQDLVAAVLGTQKRWPWQGSCGR